MFEMILRLYKILVEDRMKNNKEITILSKED